MCESSELPFVNFNCSIKTFRHIYRYPCLFALRFIFNMFISHDILFHVLDYLCDGHLLPFMGVSSLWRRMTLDRLKELKITCSDLHEVLLLVADCPRLERLDITFTGDESEQSLNSFLRLPSSLAELCCTGPVPEWWLASVTKRMPNLASVELIDNHTVTGEFLIGAPLTSIQLTDCAGIKRTTIRKVLQGCSSSLEWITFNGGCTF